MPFAHTQSTFSFCSFRNYCRDGNIFSRLSDMSQRCATRKCERTSRAPCDCCKQNLCLQHLYEHNTSLVSQLNPLTGEINALGDRLNRLNLRETARDCRKKLEEWRLDCHQKIDSFYERKCQELDHLVAIKVDEERQKILHIETKLDKLIREQEATRQDIDILTSTICQLEKEMNNIEEAHFQVNTRPLLIDDTIIQFKEIHQHDFDPSSFSSIYKTILYRKVSWDALASNGRLLLIHQAPNLCLLDVKLTVVKQVLWPYDSLFDMCWSSTLNRFIVISKENVFLVDENTMSIESVQTIAKQRWLSGTCFNDELFLSTDEWGSSIVKLRLSPSISVIKKWKSPKTCTTDEWIDDIGYNNGALAVVIRNKIEQSIRMELRCCKTLDRLWSLLLDIKYNKDIPFRCCSLDCNGWLVADYNARRLLHITRDGKMKQTIIYKAIPLRITMFTSDINAISTGRGLNLHKT